MKIWGLQVICLFLFVRIDSWVTQRNYNSGLVKRHHGYHSGSGYVIGANAGHGKPSASLGHKSHRLNDGAGNELIGSKSDNVTENIKMEKDPKIEIDDNGGQGHHSLSADNLVPNLARKILEFMAMSDSDKLQTVLDLHVDFWGCF